MDISVTACRERGEKRKPLIKTKGRELGPISNVNPFGQIMNMRKNEALVFRQANGGVEQSFCRYYGILTT